MLGRRIHKIISIVLIIAMAISTTACSDAPLSTGLSEPNEQIIAENVEVETIITEEIIEEKILTEYITSEIYLEEIVIAEDKITELLLEEEAIEEVYLCKTIYVPQEHIEEFSENSQTAQLFGDDVSITSVLEKVAVGTGVIVTLVILKKAGFSEPIASAVVAAADKSLQFAGVGAGIGTLFGGLTGATDEIDQSGRTSAVIGFAVATAGLIVTSISLVGALPSAGTTTITAAVGIKLVFAGMSVMAATGTAAYAGNNVVKTFTETDAADIDWNNIDWKKVGVSAAQKAIENSADGYMWGSIVGAVYGGVEGYEFYQKYHTPYSKYNERLVHTPGGGNKGHWSGERGESDFILDEPIVLPDGMKITKVTYKNCVPDFSPYEKAQVKIPSMTDNRYQNFKQANEALAEHWTKIKYNGQSWTARDVEIYRTNNNLTWHEMNNMGSMQLVPFDVNDTFLHLGGVGEYNAMIGVEGVSEFD